MTEPIRKKEEIDDYDVFYPDDEYYPDEYDDEEPDWDALESRHYRA